MATDKELDELAIKLDNLMWAGEFQAIQKELMLLNLETLDVDLMLCYLMMAYHGRNDIMYYPQFFQKCKAALEYRNEPDVDEILKGFE